MPWSVPSCRPPFPSGCPRSPLARARAPPSPDPTPSAPSPFLPCFCLHLAAPPRPSPNPLRAPRPLPPTAGPAAVCCGPARLVWPRVHGLHTARRLQRSRRGEQRRGRCHGGRFLRYCAPRAAGGFEFGCEHELEYGCVRLWRGAHFGHAWHWSICSNRKQQPRHHARCKATCVMWWSMPTYCARLARLAARGGGVGDGLAPTRQPSNAAQGSSAVQSAGAGRGSGSTPLLGDWWAAGQGRLHPPPILPPTTH